MEKPDSGRFRLGSCPMNRTSDFLAGPFQLAIVETCLVLVTGRGHRGSDQSNSQTQRNQSEDNKRSDHSPQMPASQVPQRNSNEFITKSLAVCPNSCHMESRSGQSPAILTGRSGSEGRIQFTEFDLEKLGREGGKSPHPSPTHTSTTDIPT